MLQESWAEGGLPDPACCEWPWPTRSELKTWPPCSGALCPSRFDPTAAQEKGFSQSEQAVVCVCVYVMPVRDAAETAINRTHTPHAETGKGAGMRSIHQRANSAQFHTVPNNISASYPKIKPVQDLFESKDSSSCVLSNTGQIRDA